MTDRELLELAAKAAGIKSTCWIDKTHEWFQREGVGYDDSNDCQQLWNPLTDDGDAMRLAVKLGLFNDEDFVAELKAIWMYSCTDYYAATRRAIVRAAAEIGKAMP